MQETDVLDATVRRLVRALLAVCTSDQRWIAKGYVLSRGIYEHGTDVDTADVDRNQLALAKRGIGAEKRLNLLRQVWWRCYPRSYLGNWVAKLRVGCRAAHGNICDEGAWDAEIVCKWHRVNAP